MAISFLESIVKGYADRATDLSDYLFVFPSRRACTFFLKNLTNALKGRIAMLPDVTTMSEFVEKVSGRVVANRIELLFIMYDAYVALQKESGASSIQEFDRFRRWGETALSDFNEVDMQDSDPDAIFKNVKDIREISSNFLTEEQLKVMEEFFGQVYDPVETATGFWKEFNDEKKDHKLQKKFLPIWQAMAPLYHAFHDALESRGLISSGGAYRQAANILEDGIPGNISAGKIVFVGFNALTRSESRIFDTLSSYLTDDESEPYADFFWDTVGPVINDKTSTAGRYVLRNKERWPSPEWAAPYLSMSEVKDMPEEIKVIAVPSNSLQAKIACDEIEEMKSKINSLEFDEAKVAVVLPDESLLIPMLYSFPDGISDVNLTMGYPLKLSGTATYVSLLRHLQSSRRKSGNDIGYYYKDLEAVLSHPFSQSLFGDAVSKVKDWIKKHHHSIVNINDVRNISNEMAQLLSPLSDNATPEEAVRWIESILLKVSESISSSGSKLLKANVDKSNLEVYLLLLNQLLETVKEYGISMQWRTFLSLSDRLLSAESVTFEGQPLRGLQVMGMLETRALDFDRIIIPSLNERILPAKRRARTFISDSLRRAYGLPPVNYSESIFAYYFFRMIARAKEVVLLYDARSSEGARSGDVSRYVLQLQYLYAKNTLKLETRSFDITKSDLKPAPIEKTKEILDLLSAYRDPGENGRNLSATALTRYTDCQIRFYFEHLLRIKTDEESVEYIDAITQGNIVHFVMQNIYLPSQKQGHYLDHPEIIDANLIKAKKEESEGKDSLISILITRGINKEHFHRKEEDWDTPLSGSTAYVAKVLHSQILNILDFDLKQAPFLLYGVEIAGNVSIKMPDGLPVNMRFAIDRLDRPMRSATSADEMPLRIVDYKTGSPHVKTESMQSVFEGDFNGKNLLQLWLYANLFDALPNKNIPKNAPRPELRLFGENSGLPRQPLTLEIYDVPSIKKGGVKKEGSHKIDDPTYPIVGDTPQPDHTGLNSEFLNLLEKTLTQLFAEGEFMPTQNPRSCTLCPFKTICWK
ncbi:MAG: PD-(D/E)XK nuclease family protein [Muribaculaceae bacterium]|nr:PD-(D/E)XK nuclease family protein [Muribaculaceae bacterium]